MVVSLSLSDRREHVFLVTRPVIDMESKALLGPQWSQYRYMSYVLTQDDGKAQSGNLLRISLSGAVLWS